MMELCRRSRRTWIEYREGIEREVGYRKVRVEYVVNNDDDCELLASSYLKFFFSTKVHF